MSILDVTSGTSYATLSEAISGSSAGDVLQVPAGTYVEDFPNITHSLTIEGVGGMASLRNPQVLPPNGRAILNVPGDLNVSLSIDHVELSGANNDTLGNSNAAGILFESGNATLTVSNSWIHDNEDGILTGGATAASLSGMHAVIINTELDHNGAPPGNPRYGFDHNLYANDLTSLTVTGSYFHDALGGHEIKSRAHASTITGNRIEDGPTAQTSYSIDLPNGGNNVVSANSLIKGAAAVNKYVIHFGGEGNYPDSTLLVDSNIFVNQRPAGAVALFNQTQGPGGANVPATVTSNTLTGFGQANLVVDSAGTPVDVISGNVFLTPCFRAGTRLLTVTGPVAVEALASGDRMVLADGRTAPVVWVGHRRVDCRRHPRPQDVMPVHVRPGAFGPGRPVRELVLSPDHAVFVAGEGQDHPPGVLIPVRYLLNGRTIFQSDTDSVTYFHVELDAHAILLAEGLPCESYLDTGNRAGFANGGGAVNLHADFAPAARAVWAARACAGLVLAGPLLAAAKARLLAQAAALGHVATDDPALRVIAGGRVLPAERDGAGWRASLPAGAGAVRLVSRRWVPMHARADEQDSRVLGVALAALRFDGVPIGLDDARLSSGWHAPEATWRWTDGDAGIALAGVRELRFDVVMAGRYWDGEPAPDPGAAADAARDQPARNSWK